jgi:catechol 2,3-dioxygenase-like lactoylglutathione lyase family enzyme
MQIKRLTPMLKVSDIERSLKFYQKLVGFELVSPRRAVDQWRWAWIRSDQRLAGDILWHEGI